MSDGKKMLSLPNVQGVMLGRAGIGRPWLLQEKEKENEKEIEIKIENGKENNQAGRPAPYLIYAHLLTEAWAQAGLSTTQILARLKAISHWWPALPLAQRTQLLHQTSLKKFLLELEKK